MEIDSNFVIFDCKPGSNNLIMGFEVAIVLSKTLDIITTMAFGNLIKDLEGNYKAIYAMLNNRMWMVHDRVKCTRLSYECMKIGKPPPTPTSIIDTSLFTSSKTKLGRAAVMFGLGMQKHGSVCLDINSNLSAILRCREMMSKLDVPMKTLNDTVHPMLYHLMQYNDQMNDEARARYFNEAEYTTFNKIDDLSIMLLVDDVLKKHKDELKKQREELEKQMEEERMDIVYYNYEEIEGEYTYKGDKLNKHDDGDVEHQTRNDDDDDDDEEEFARTRGIKDQDQDDEDD